MLSDAHSGVPRAVNSDLRPDDAEVTLLLDADDTLWENNVYFLEVTERFIEAVAAHGVQRDTALRVLSDTEARNIERHGYGSRSFALSLAEAFVELADGHDAETVQQLQEHARAIFDRETIELRLGVREALETLSRSHRLVLVTKGDPEEQRRKLDRSGLAHHFEWIEVVAEKRVDVYQDLTVRLGLDPDRTWMVGNSPRSDINPALAAGLRAVFIPHPQTWELELEDIEHEAGERLLIADSLTELARLFTKKGDP